MPDAAIDALIRALVALEGQQARLTNDLQHLRTQLAAALGDQRTYTGYPGLIVTKAPRVRYEINGHLLHDVLAPDDLEAFKELVFTKSTCDAALAAGHLPPFLYDQAVARVDQGWVVRLQRMPEGPDVPTA